MVEILVFGDSDTSGRHTGGAPWPELLTADLVDAGRGPVNVRFSSFSPVPANSAEFAARKVGETKPDIAILVVASFPFTARFVRLRVERLFGKRAGRWYKRLEDNFDTSTRGKSGGRDHLNRVARRVVPKVVGSGAYSTREKVTANYVETLRALSRFEDTDVVVFSYPGMAASTNTPWAVKQRKLFFAEMKAAASQQRMPWVDGVEIFAGHAREDVMADGFHFNQAGHRIIADALLAAVRQLE